VAVADVNPDITDRDRYFLGEPGMVRRIGIPENRPDRRDELELVQDLLPPYVPGVED